MVKKKLEYLDMNAVCGRTLSIFGKTVYLLR